MIEYIAGRLVEKHPTHAVIGCHGLGYKVHIPLSSYSALGEVGADVKLLTYHHVREDTEELYGFATAEERSIFVLLIGVSGIGPRLAQTILSGLPVASFRDALIDGDLATLTRIPGVGKKTAERMVVELKDKIVKLLPESVGGPGERLIAGDGDEAVLALVSLGYNRHEARQAVGRIRQKEGSDLPVEEIVRAAIQAGR